MAADNGADDNAKDDKGPADKDDKANAGDAHAADAPGAQQCVVVESQAHPAPTEAAKPAGADAQDEAAAKKAAKEAKEAHRKLSKERNALFGAATTLTCVGDLRVWVSDTTCNDGELLKDMSAIQAALTSLGKLAPYAKDALQPFVDTQQAPLSSIVHKSTPSSNQLLVHLHLSAFERLNAFLV